MRHYTKRRTRPADLDAARERKPAPGARDDNRQPGRLLLDIGSQVFDLHLEPDPRNVRCWKAQRNGELFLRAGLEQIWRKIQREIAPPLGRRHWG